MATTRIKDLTEALSADTDDYVVIDGATNGTRKLSADNIGGEKEYDFTTTISPSMDARGVSQYSYNITPANSSDITVANALKIKGYLLSGNYAYPLINVYSSVSSGTYFFTTFKSIYSNVQGTSTSSISGTLHIVAPFEISNVTSGM